MALQQHITSTGHRLSDAAFLDLHFEICREEYTQFVENAGFKPGWHVLDAGCGAGSFLPLIAEQVGATGKLTAVDLAPENVELTRERIEGWGLANVVEVREASILELPFEDNAFDGVWCANVSQYLAEEELDRSLRDSVRVTRPGGLVAMKETAGIFTTFEPAPPAAKHLPLTAAARQKGDSAYSGTFRTWRLKSLMERSGLVNTRQRTMLAELRAPLTNLERLGIGKLLALHAEVAAGLELPAEYQDFWEKQQDPDSLDSILNHPEFYFAKGLTLALGTVPES